MFKSHFNHAFTLAEVLITIGLIGLIAALTLPSLIADARKKATAAHLKKFYNTMNNAVQFSVAKYGDAEYWIGEVKNLTYEENLDYLNTYFLPYIKYNRYDNCYENAVCVYMETGGMFFFRYDAAGGDIVYFVNGKYNPNATIKEKRRNAFAFQFNKNNGSDENNNKIIRENRRTSVEPYVYQWDGAKDSLKNSTTRGCNTSATPLGTYCTKLIQMNSWEIPDDYPW